MQPYFLPYIGYWQLMHYVDTFVIYDNVEYTKKGWINRNRFLSNGHDQIFSIPLRKDSDRLDVMQRRVAETFPLEKQKLIRRFESAYRKAPFFDQGIGLLNSALASEESNLFLVIYQSIRSISEALGISTQLVISSSLNVDVSLKGQDRVIATCLALRASEYINPIGGLALYKKDAFENSGLILNFQRVKPYQYNQFDHPFVSHLSIIDVVMFNGVQGTQRLLEEMEVF